MKKFSSQFYKRSKWNVNFFCLYLLIFKLNVHKILTWLELSTEEKRYINNVFDSQCQQTYVLFRLNIYIFVPYLFVRVHFAPQLFPQWTSFSIISKTPPSLHNYFLNQHHFHLLFTFLNFQFLSQYSTRDSFFHNTHLLQQQ